MDLTGEILELKRFAFLPDEDDAPVFSFNAGKLVAPGHPDLLDLLLHEVLHSWGPLGKISVLFVANDEDGGAEVIRR